MKEQESLETWNKKRIFLTLGVLLLVSAALFAVYFKNFKESQKPSIVVKGVNVKPQNLNISKGLEDKIHSLTQEAGNINIIDLASSSPQVKKVINDLKSLENYPKNQVREMCEKVCSNL